MSLPDDAWDAVRAYVAALSGLSALLAGGSTDAIRWGWPQALLDPPYGAATEYPIITGHIATLRNERPGAGPFQVPLNLWVWPTGANGGLARMKAIDTILEDGLEEANFKLAGTDRRVFVLDMSARDWPQAKGAPLRRIRTLRCGF